MWVHIFRRVAVTATVYPTFYVLATLPVPGAVDYTTR